MCIYPRLTQPLTFQIFIEYIQVLYDVVNCFVGGLIQLLNKNVEKAFQDILVAFNLLSTNGFLSILEPLYTFILPCYQETVEDIATAFGDGTVRSKVAFVNTNFMAYKHQSLIYTTWYTLNNRFRVESTDVETQPRKAEDENRNPILETCLKPESGKKLDSSNIMSLLNYSTALLLDSTHSKFYNLKKRLRKVNEQLTTLEIKQRLKEHLAMKKTVQKSNNKKPTTDASTKSSVEADVKDFLDELVEKVMKTFPTQEELEIKSLKNEKFEMSSHLEKLPDYIKVTSGRLLLRM